MLIKLLVCQISPFINPAFVKEFISEKIFSVCLCRTDGSHIIKFVPVYQNRDFFPERLFKEIFVMKLKDRAFFQKLMDAPTPGDMYDIIVNEGNAE